MFSMPTIPTDSLYKFLFVGGIVLMIASLFFVFQNYNTERSITNYRDSTLNVLTYRLNESINDHKKIKKLFDQYNSKKPDTTLVNEVDNVSKPDTILTNSVSRLVSKYNSNKISLQEFNKIAKSEAKKNPIRRKKLFEKKYGSYNIAVKNLKGLIDTLDNNTNKLDVMITKRGFFIDSITNELYRHQNKYSNEEQKLHSANIFLLIMTASGLVMTIFGLILWRNKIQIPQDRLLDIQVELAEIELRSKQPQLKPESPPE